MLSLPGTAGAAILKVVVRVLYFDPSRELACDCFSAAVLSAP